MLHVGSFLKAFDTVNWHALWQILRGNCVCGHRMWFFHAGIIGNRLRFVGNRVKFVVLGRPVLNFASARGCDKVVSSVHDCSVPYFQRP